MSYKLEDLRWFELYYGTEIINILKALHPFQVIYIRNETDGSVSKLPAAYAERKLVGKTIFITSRYLWAALETDKFGKHWGFTQEDIKNE